MVLLTGSNLGFVRTVSLRRVRDVLTTGIIGLSLANCLTIVADGMGTIGGIL